MRDLLIRYDEVTPHGRPVLNHSSTVNVQFGLGLIQMELDEKEKALSLSLWTKYVNICYSHLYLLVEIIYKDNKKAEGLMVVGDMRVWRSSSLLGRGEGVVRVFTEYLNRLGH